MADLICWNCGGSLADISRPISRHATCSHCFEVLHCCQMCRHYMPDKRPYCDHDRAEPPVEKTSANFCDYFKPVNRFEAKSADRADKAKNDLDALFGGDSEDVIDDSESPDDVFDRDPGDPRNKLDDLFND